MGNTIYVLAIIGWVVYNIYKASQKVKAAVEVKKAYNPQEEDSSEQQPSIETILEEMLAGKKAAKKQQQAPQKAVIEQPAY